MKYCPYCGSVLPDTDVLFCPECGKKLSSRERQKVSAQKPEKQLKKNRKSNPEKKEDLQYATLQPDGGSTEDSSKSEEGYDGYYDDVCPSDEGSQSEGIDKETLKKIVLLAVGVLFTIGICVTFMYLI